MVHNLHLSNYNDYQAKEFNDINIKLFNRERHIDRSSTKKAAKIQRIVKLLNVLPLLLLVLKLAIYDSTDIGTSLVDSHSEENVYLSRCGDVFSTIAEAKNDNRQNAWLLTTTPIEKGDNHKKQRGCEQSDRPGLPMTTALVPIYRNSDQCVERTVEMNDLFKVWRHIAKEWRQPSNYVKRDLLRKFIRQMERGPESLETLGSSVVYLHPWLDLRVHYNVSKGSLQTQLEVATHQEESYWPVGFSQISQTGPLDTSEWELNPTMEKDFITFLDDMVKNVIEAFWKHLFWNLIRIPNVATNERPHHLASEDTQHAPFYGLILTLEGTLSWSSIIRDGIQEKGQTPVASPLSNNHIIDVSQSPQEIPSTPLTESDQSLSMAISESEAGQNFIQLHVIQHTLNPSVTTTVPLMENSLSIPVMEAGGNQNTHYLHATQHQSNSSEVSLPVMETWWTTAIAETGIDNINNIFQNTINPSVTTTVTSIETSLSIAFMEAGGNQNTHYLHATQHQSNSSEVSLPVMETVWTTAIAETGINNINNIFQNPTVSTEIIYFREIELSNLQYTSAIEETAMNLEQNISISILPVTPSIAETGSDHMQDNPLIVLQVHLFHQMYADSEHYTEAVEEDGESDTG